MSAGSSSLLRPAPARRARVALLAGLVLAGGAADAAAATPAPDPSPLGGVAQPDPFPLVHAAPVVRTPVSERPPTVALAPFTPPAAIRPAQAPKHARPHTTAKRSQPAHAAPVPRGAVFHVPTQLTRPVSTAQVMSARPRASRSLALALGLLVLLSGLLVGGVARAAVR